MKNIKQAFPVTIIPTGEDFLVSQLHYFNKPLEPTSAKINFSENPYLLDYQIIEDKLNLESNNSIFAETLKYELSDKAIQLREDVVLDTYKVWIKSEFVHKSHALFVIEPVEFSFVADVVYTITDYCIKDLPEVKFISIYFQEIIK